MKSALLVGLVLLCAASLPSAAQQLDVSPQTESGVGAAPAAPPGAATPTRRWYAIAGGLWRVRGRAHVAIGYAGGRGSLDDAKAVAEAQCRSAGGRNCKAIDTWNVGCGFITTGASRRTAGWVSAKTSEDVTRRCRNNGYTECRTPIGGCAD